MLVEFYGTQEYKDLVKNHRLARARDFKQSPIFELLRDEKAFKEFMNA